MISGFIDEHMQEISRAFTRAAQQRRRLCHLRALHFYGAEPVDYQDDLVQRLYHLRYAPMYILEYYLIYSAILAEGTVEDGLRVLSLGSGSGLDYHSFRYAVDPDKGQLRAPDYTYTGVDRVRWVHSPNPQSDAYRFRQMDVADLSPLFLRDFNTVIFPKSIGELSERSFTRLVQTFRTTTFPWPDLYIAASVTVRREEEERDRFQRIVESLEKNGYLALTRHDDEGALRDDGSLRIANTGPLFDLHYDHPLHIYNAAYDPYQYCQNPCRIRDEQTGEVRGHCYNSRRAPMLSTEYMRYSIQHMARKHEYRQVLTAQPGLISYSSVKP